MLRIDYMERLGMNVSFLYRERKINKIKKHQKEDTGLRWEVETLFRTNHLMDNLEIDAKKIQKSK